MKQVTMKSYPARWIPICMTLIITLFCGSVVGQRLVEWISSDYVEYDEARFGKVRRAIGSVHFRHEGTELFCDSAYFFEETNRIEASSNFVFFGSFYLLPGWQLPEVR